MFKTRSVYRSFDKDRHFRFGHRDRAGREIGCSVSSGEQRMEEYVPEGMGGWSTMAPGLYFYACVQATRDWYNYGASQMLKHFTTVEGRDAYIDKRVAASKKAAEKRAGK